MQLLNVRIKKFKSIKDQQFDLHKLNVLVGANGSGKTNLLEFFKLIRLSLTSNSVPFNPFTAWWGFQNVVWMKDISNIIEGHFSFYDKKAKRNIIYQIYLGINQYGNATIVYEKLTIKGLYSFEKIGEEITFRYDEKYFVETIIPNIEYIETKLKIDKKVLQELATNSYLVKERRFFSLSSNNYNTNTLLMQIGHILKIKIHDTTIILPFDIVVTTEKVSERRIISYNWYILRFFDKLILLRPPDLRKIRDAAFPFGADKLHEDGTNLVATLYHMKNAIEKDSKFSSLMDLVVRLYPNTRIAVNFTKDGRTILNVYEGDLELAPHGISDGFYKVLYVLTAIELKPSLLLIDEIENSLYKNAIEFILDVLKESGVQTIIATHSPIVIDLLDLDTVIICKKKQGQTTFIRPKNIPILKKQLAELGITHSEAWLSDNLEED